MNQKTRFAAILMASALLFGGCSVKENENAVSYESESGSSVISETEKSAEESYAVTSEDVSAEEEKSDEIPSEEPVSEESSEEEIDYPYIYTDKETYTRNDQITVFYKNTDTLDWVGIYPGTAEPGTMSSLTWQYSVGEGKLTFYTSSLKETGEYGIFLCDNDGYDVLCSVKITILDDDKTDYGVKDAVYRTENADGLIKAYSEISPASGKELTYTVNWSKNGKILDDYMPVLQKKHSGEDAFRLYFNDCLYMPGDADGIAISVKEGESTTFFTSADDTLKLKESKLLYKFSVLTDLHITPDRSAHISHLKAALREINRLAPDSTGIFTVGDNTNGGTKEDYELLLRTVEEGMGGSEIPIYYGLGNHELIFNGTYASQMELFKKYTGMPGAYFSVAVDETKAIFLGSDEQVGEGVMHKEQLDWLENELSSVGTEKPVYLFMHQPLIETVSGSFYSKNPKVQYWYGFSGANSRLRALLRNYPNAILFTGHTHWTFESEGPILYGNGKDASFVNCGAVGYLWTDDDDSTGGSEGYYVEVYEDYILIRGREFVSGKWCGAAQFMLPIK